MNLVIKKIEKKMAANKDCLSIINAPFATFEVFCAKDICTPDWRTAENFDIRSLVLRSRQSYIQRYGDNIPVLDAYDIPAAVYLVRVSYAGGEEWLSARFAIPNTCLSSIDSHQFLQSKYQNHPLLEAIEDISHEGLKHIVIVSRICGFVNKFDNADENNLVTQPLRYTAYAFALMLNQLILDYGTRYNIKFFLGLYRDELIKKSLTSVVDGISLPIFSFGTELIPGSIRKDFTIDRNISAYEHPAYFFKANELSVGLRDLIQRGILKLEDVADHLISHKNIIELMAGKSLDYGAFRNLGPVLITDCVRRELEPLLSDGPELRVINTAEWLEHFQSITNQFIR